MMACYRKSYSCRNRGLKRQGGLEYGFDLEARAGPTFAKTYALEKRSFDSLLLSRQGLFRLSVTVYDILQHTSVWCALTDGRP